MIEGQSAPAPSPIGRRWWLNLLLALFVAALAALVLYTRGREEEGGKGTTLLALAPEAVTRIRVERPGAPSWRIEKTEAGFRLVEPFAARVDEFNLRQLQRIAALKSVREITAQAAGDEALRRYGLAPPKVRVWLDGEALDVGERHPLEMQRYVLYRGAVHLVPDHALAPVFYEPSQLLDTRLLEEGFELLALELPGFSLEYKDGTWQRRPARQALSSDRINDFVAEWRNARAISVERATARRPRAWIVLRLKRGGDGKPSTLRIGILARDPELVLWRPDEGLAYHFPSQTAKRLLELDS